MCFVEVLVSLTTLLQQQAKRPLFLVHFFFFFFFFYIFQRLDIFGRCALSRQGNIPTVDATKEEKYVVRLKKPGSIVSWNPRPWIGVGSCRFNLFSIHQHAPCRNIVTQHIRGMWSLSVICKSGSALTAAYYVLLFIHIAVVLVYTTIYSFFFNFLLILRRILKTLFFFWSLGQLNKPIVSTRSRLVPSSSRGNCVGGEVNERDLWLISYYREKETSLCCAPNFMLMIIFGVWKRKDDASVNGGGLRPIDQSRTNINSHPKFYLFSLE